MRVITVNHVVDTDRLADLPETWEVYQTEDPIGPTYYRLAQRALFEDWGNETIVIQDDVRLKVDPVDGDEVCVLYGDFRSPPAHACPRAFSATRPVWERLADVWAKHPDRLCSSFTRTLLTLGVGTRLVPDGIEHLEEPGSRPWPRR